MLPFHPSRFGNPAALAGGGFIAVPVNLTPPERDGIGDEDVGTLITCTSVGTWTGSPTSYEYQWHDSVGPISGATSDSYTLTAANMNQGIFCAVTALNAGGASLPAETQTYSTAAARLSNTVPPAATDDNGGTAPANITTNDGTWDSNPPNPTITYDWSVNGGPLGDVDNSHAAATAGDYVCSVTASNGYSTPVSANSNIVTLI